MTLLESVVTELNAQRQADTPAISVNAMTAGDAADVFNYTDRMLSTTGYIQGESWNYLSDTDNEEHERYLAAVLSLLESGYDAPLGTVSF